MGSKSTAEKNEVFSQHLAKFIRVNNNTFGFFALVLFRS